jgi:NADH dehydrogenase/NADH:ubiquinone oxidoreductase subunit G
MEEESTPEAESAHRALLCDAIATLAEKRRAEAAAEADRVEQERQKNAAKYANDARQLAEQHRALLQKHQDDEDRLRGALAKQRDEHARQQLAAARDDPAPAVAALQRQVADLQAQIKAGAAAQPGAAAAAAAADGRRRRSRSRSSSRGRSDLAAHREEVSKEIAALRQELTDKVERVNESVDKVAGAQTASTTKFDDMFRQIMARLPA